MVIKNDLFQLVCEPTHNDNNILDLVLSNVDSLSVSVSKELFSDHFPAYFYFSSIPVPICPHIMFSKSSFNAILFDRNSQQLSNFLSRDSSFSFTYHDDWYSLLVDSFIESNKIERGIRKKLPPFYSSHTVHLTNQKSTLRKFENDASFLLAIKLRDINISLSISIEMDKEILVNQFDLTSTRHCFKLLRCLGFNSSIPSVMILGNESFHTNFDIGLAFNRFFASVFNETVAHSAPLQCEVPTIKLNDLSLSLPDVRYLLECSDDSNAVGADGIPSFLLYQCSNILCTPTFELFNWILKNQLWPDIWKQAHVTPLHKSGAHNDIANYRPISILPNFSLILERILFNNIYPKLRHLIKLEQYGIMKSRSTVSQLIMYLDAVHSSRDANFSAVSVYFDIRKAFDSLPHIKFLSKLANFGFDSEFLHLIHSHLTNRSQCLKIHQTLSFPLRVTSGVPQGSVLGPLLFLLFVNDIADNVENCSFYLLADDLKIFSTSPNSLVRDDINALLDWSNLNGLQFYPKKCTALNFGGHDKCTISAWGRIPAICQSDQKFGVYCIQLFVMETSC